jgi:hypothetical protein
VLPQTIGIIVIITVIIVAEEMNAMSFPGEVLRMTHVARGLDSDGALLLDVIVSGQVLQLHSPAEVGVKVTCYESIMVNHRTARSTNEIPVDRAQRS